MSRCFIDFEFNNTQERDVNLVSCSFTIVKKGDKSGQIFEYWLHNDKKEQEALRKHLLELKHKGFTFFAYAVEAEARSFLALGLNPLDFKWCDLYLEYRQLLNHNHKLSYGKQLIDGKVKFTKPPKNKWDMSEEDKKKADMSKPNYGMASAIYKLLGLKIDTAFKDETRDLIISAPKSFTHTERSQIVQYCTSDITHLSSLFKAMIREYRVLFKKVGNTELIKTLPQEMTLRAEYSCRTALMVRQGYPINREHTLNFSRSVADILYELQTEINSFFPDIQPFEWDKRQFKYVWKQKKTKEWVAKYAKEKGIVWMKTKKKDFSLSLDAFEQYFHFRHDFPTDNFGAQMVRYLKTKRNLNGFLPTSGKKKNFWDSVAKNEDRVRPYFGIYGSQSSRSQPSATGFLFLKSAWMRALCQPKKGRAVLAIDFGSQEFLLAALMSKDENMIKAYESGDPYLYFAKLAGAVPWEGTKAEYPEERNLFKSTTLGLSYGMGAKMLALKLTADIGREVTQEEAQDLIDKFNLAYPDYYLYRRNIVDEYRLEGYLKLPCGWFLWPDNINMKSVGNFPIQGFGSSIMRKSVELAQEAGLDVIKTLHDALYVEFDVGRENETIEKLAKAMDEGFRFYFSGETYDRASVRLDADIWSPSYNDFIPEITVNIETNIKSTYIDPRAKAEYERFSEYFYNNLENFDI